MAANAPLGVSQEITYVRDLINSISHRFFFQIHFTSHGIFTFIIE